jgi:hypothetical protein
VWYTTAMAVDLNQGLAIVVLGAIAWFIRFQLFPLIRDEWRKSQETRTMERKAYEAERQARDDERKLELIEFRGALTKRDAMLAEQLALFRQELATRDTISRDQQVTNTELLSKLGEVTRALTHNREQRTRNDDDTTNC